MTRLPTLADWLLTRFGAVDDALVGDLQQEWSAGRSVAWLWHQTIAAIAWGAVREIRRQPGRTGAVLLAGWIVVGLIFLKGDTIAGGLASLIWGWQRQDGYAHGNWRPFYAGALVVSYGGFGVSAWLVARISRGQPAMLLSYVAATFAILMATGIVMDVLVRRGDPIPLIHPLFYAVWVTLPFLWYSGIVLVPLTMLACGMLVRRDAPRTPASDDLLTER